MTIYTNQMAELYVNYENGRLSESEEADNYESIEAVRGLISFTPDAVIFKGIATQSRRWIEAKLSHDDYFDGKPFVVAEFNNKPQESNIIDLTPLLAKIERAAIAKDE